MTPTSNAPASNAAISSASAPATAAEVREAVLEASARTTPVRIAACGTWLDAGRPVRVAHRLSVAALDGITEYTPGDLTLTARAGTSLAEIARVTSAERQWLALDPHGSPAGSLGATIACASAGPLAHAYGTPRDNVLGLEAVTGTGAVVRAGGRVVKNVAGFDLTRLFTGSWGTLGVITEVTVRLRALPEVDESHAIPVDDDVASLGALAAQLRTAAIAPLALELVNAALAERLGLQLRAHVLVRLGGNEDDVRAQRAVLGALGDPVSVSAEVWTTLRGCEPASAAVVRFSMPPSRIAECWTFACGATANTNGAPVHASLGRGVVRCIVPYERATELGAFLAAARAFTGTRVIERLPAACWTDDVAPSKVADRLSRDLKRRFDPMNVLNPGILGVST
ncbi:MAG TPA: FAD-binding oxidoreductase [Gemmatimonadaceae bacterium]|nr:FAD-binding oxidoreductase [Gemmatimonadaceae bacterium]